MTGPRPLNKWHRREIVAWDGEGANLDDGTHIYNLLANSFGKYVVNHNGLTTEQAFQFLLRYSKPKAINVIFGGSYDVNMILGTVPEEKIRQLWQTGTTYWGRYSISYAHRKRFSIAEYTRLTHKKKPSRKIVLWDVLGFFQSSFVKACRKWLGEDFAGQLKVFDEIQDMKDQRSTFSVGKIDDIIKYNYVECQMLVLLVEALFSALDKAGIELQRYDGAGAIAAALLRQHNILSHKGTIPKQVEEWAQYAYSGGRIEAPKVGNDESISVYRYDINSAYPSAALELPSYAGARFSFDPEWNGLPSSIVEVEWHFTDEAPFYPLWYRCPDGTILYPAQGHGRYFGAEIEILADAGYKQGIDYHIIQACNVEPALDSKPFDFLRQVYAIRREFKRNGSMANEAIKLGMNSIYGKLAQQAGYRHGRIPTYHHLLWAGQITATTRANLYRAAIQHPDTVIAFATDAIFSQQQHRVSCGDGLGQWTPEVFSGITLVQAGVYWLRDDQGEWADKYRGFDHGALDRQEILNCWISHEDYHANLTRFYGMGSAVGMNNFTHYWRCWRTEPRKLSLYPDGKRIAGPHQDYANGLCRTLPRMNPYDMILSAPYPLAWGLGGPKEPVDGIDIRTLEEEIIDSYV